MKINGFLQGLVISSLLATSTVSYEANASVLLKDWGNAGESGFGNLAMQPNDDGSSEEIFFSQFTDLGFDSGVNFFGTTHDSFYINNNGNITFNEQVGEFTPEQFPISSQPMIAPFWADVDTGCDTCGNVYFGSPNAETLVITWDQVGFYNENSSLTNTFQLVLIDREDTGAGNFDVEFRYEDINWTVGDASGGINGLPPGEGESSEGQVATFAFFNELNETASVLALLDSYNPETMPPLPASVVALLDSVPEELELAEALATTPIAELTQAVQDLTIFLGAPQVQEYFDSETPNLSALLIPALLENPANLIELPQEILNEIPGQFVANIIEVLESEAPGITASLPETFVATLPEHQVTYENLDDSEGDFDNEEFVIAQAGYDAGDGETFFTLPASRTSDMVDIDEANSNSGTPGVWTFSFRDGDLPDGSEDNPFMPGIIDPETPENYNFEFIISDPATPIFIDPFVAIGYDYIVNNGPNIASVILPTGFDDNLFDLWLWDDNLGDWIDAATILTGGVEYTFSNPLDRFRILGIDTDSMVDPLSPTAFITGLTFDRAGAINMNQNAVTVFVDENATVVSEPSVLALFGLSLLVLVRTKRKFV